MVQVHFRDPFWELAIGYPGITQQEIHELQMGDMRVAIADIDDLLFFLVSVGRIPWADAPYEPRLASKPIDYPCIEEAKEGAPLLLCVVETTTGEIKAMRLMGLGHLMSNRLHERCRELDRQRPLDMADYKQRVDAIYRKYPSSEAMLTKVNPNDIFLFVDQSQK